MSERYTQSEVARIVGLDRRRLRYWERLRLVRPVARWGERFYTFSDLIALRTIKRLTDQKIPASRLRRALSALQHEMGGAFLPLERLRVLDHGKQLVVVAPDALQHPFAPLTRQWVFPFDVPEAKSKLHQMDSRTAEEWFENALECESRPELISDAIYAYRQVIRLAPDWIEAYLNLGVAHYQLAEWEEARKVFAAAVEIDPASPIARYNLGCVLEEMGEIDEAISQLKRAIRTTPGHADAHFNLALAYERKNDHSQARQHWSLYLRYDPNGPWADTARSRIALRQNRAPIPFPRRTS